MEQIKYGSDWVAGDVVLFTSGGRAMTVAEVYLPPDIMVKIDLIHHNEYGEVMLTKGVSAPCLIRVRTGMDCRQKMEEQLKLERGDQPT